MAMIVKMISILIPIYMPIKLCRHDLRWRKSLVLFMSCFSQQPSLPQLLIVFIVGLQLIMIAISLSSCQISIPKEQGTMCGVYLITYFICLSYSCMGWVVRSNMGWQWHLNKLSTDLTPQKICKVPGDYVICVVSRNGNHNCKMFLLFFQHANEDVEKMILGNKCDMDDRRVVSKERGDQVSSRLNNNYTCRLPVKTLCLLRCGTLSVEQLAG